MTDEHPVGEPAGDHAGSYLSIQRAASDTIMRSRTDLRGLMAGIGYPHSSSSVLAPGVVAAGVTIVTN